MGEFKSDSSVKRIMKNGVFAALRFAVYTVSGIFFIPFLIKQYGSGTYGLIALAGFLTQYVGLISGCVSASVTRFLNIAMNRNDWRQANEIFSTAIIANVGFILLQLPLFVFGVWKLDWLIDFPAEIGLDFRILVVCNIALFFINILKGVFFTPIHAANRLDIGEKFEIVSQLLRLGLLFGLITGIGPKLWIIGVVDLGLSLIFFAIGLSIFHRLVQSNLVFRRQDITWKWALPVLNMAGWSLVSALGYAFFTRTDIWIINRFVSKDMAGIYAALLVWPNFIKQIGGQLSSLISPVYMIDFAKNNHDRIIMVCMFSNKILCLFASISVGFVFVFADAILGLWLGAEYAQYSFLLKLMAIGLVFTLGESVVWGIFPAINKTHYTGIANLITGLLNLGLSLALVHAGYGVYGVAIGTLVSTLLKSSLVLPYGAARELGFPYRRFLQSYAMAGMIFGILHGVGHLFHESITNHVFVSAAVFAGVVLLLLPVLFYLGFTKMERAQVLAHARIRKRIVD